MVISSGRDVNRERDVFVTEGRGIESGEVGLEGSKVELRREVRVECSWAE